MFFFQNLNILCIFGQLVFSGSGFGVDRFDGRSGSDNIVSHIMLEGKQRFNNKKFNTLNKGCLRDRIVLEKELQSAIDEYAQAGYDAKNREVVMSIRPSH
jgi:hypothetical protein